MCREYDYIARMGGDEFVVLLPGAGPGDVHTKIAQLREAVQHVGRSMFGGNPMTVSIGVAHFPLDGRDAEQLLAEADRRMYKEKRTHEKGNKAPEPAWNTDWAATIQ